MPTGIRLLCGSHTLRCRVSYTKANGELSADLAIFASPFIYFPLYSSPVELLVRVCARAVRGGGRGGLVHERSKVRSDRFSPGASSDRRDPFHGGCSVIPCLSGSLACSWELTYRVVTRGNGRLSTASLFCLQHLKFSSISIDLFASVQGRFGVCGRRPMPREPRGELGQPANAIQPCCNPAASRITQLASFGLALGIRGV